MFVNGGNLSSLCCSGFFAITRLESEVFISYFDETKWNIAVVDQKSIVESDVNEHKLKLDIVFSSSDFVVSSFKIEYSFFIDFSSMLVLFNFIISYWKT